MAQDRMKQTMTDPMLEGTGQPGELADTPIVPSTMQDPALVGTGQPGELVGTPETPSPGFLRDLKAQEAEMRAKAAKRKAEIDIGKVFSIIDITDDLGLEFNPFDNKGEKK